MTPGQLLFNVTVVTMNPSRQIVADGAVAWQADRIVAVGKTDELLRLFADFERIDGNGGLVTPGFVDAHVHSAHFLMKGMLDDMALESRWKTRLYPFEQAVSGEEIYWGASGTFAEQLLHGTTCVGDPGCAHPHAVAGAAEDLGNRLVITGAISDAHDPLRPLLGAEGGARGALDYSRRLFDELDGASDGRVRVTCGLWNPSTASDDLCRGVRDLAEAREAIIQGHLATRESDNLDALARHGCRAVERYRRLGLLGPPLHGSACGRHRCFGR